MNQTQILLILFVVLVVAAAFLFLWRRRDETPAPAPRDPAPRPAEGHGLADSAAAAAADVAGPFVGVDAHPDVPAGPPDALTHIKGLGPKACTHLASLGIVRYDQIAAWSDADVAAIDPRMGAFQGRIVRDKWVEQARYLAAGDVAGFEAKFGKLGG